MFFFSRVPKMITTIKIIDRLNEWKGWSDYRIAKMLEVSHQAVSKWRNKGVIMSDDAAIKAAEILRLPPEFILANIHAERALNSPAYGAAESIAEAIEEKFKEEIKGSEAAQGFAA